MSYRGMLQDCDLSKRKRLLIFVSGIGMDRDMKKAGSLPAVEEEKSPFLFFTTHMREKNDVADIG